MKICGEPARPASCDINTAFVLVGTFKTSIAVCCGGASYSLLCHSFSALAVVRDIGADWISLLYQIQHFVLWSLLLERSLLLLDVGDFQIKIDSSATASYTGTSSTHLRQSFVPLIDLEGTFWTPWHMYLHSSCWFSVPFEMVYPLNRLRLLISKVAFDCAVVEGSPPCLDVDVSLQRCVN